MTSNAKPNMQHVTANSKKRGKENRSNSGKLALPGWHWIHESLLIPSIPQYSVFQYIAAGLTSHGKSWLCVQRLGFPTKSCSKTSRLRVWSSSSVVKAPLKTGEVQISFPYDIGFGYNGIQWGHRGHSKPLTWHVGRDPLGYGSWIQI